MKQSFKVENIKCGGCANSIRNGLEHLPGVAAAKADSETGTVTVEYDEDTVSEAAIIGKLSDLGYPLAGENTLGKKAVSYVSCIIGRLGGDVDGVPLN